MLFSLCRCLSGMKCSFGQVLTKVSLWASFIFKWLICWVHETNKPKCLILKWVHFLLSVCDMKCGDSGCVNGGLMGKSTSCCDKQCLGGCTKTNSPHHCYACRNFRMPKGECVEKCGTGLYEVQRITVLSWYLVAMF